MSIALPADLLSTVMKSPHYNFSSKTPNLLLSPKSRLVNRYTLLCLAVNRLQMLEEGMQLYPFVTIPELQSNATTDCLLSIKFSSTSKPARFEISYFLPFYQS